MQNELLFDGHCDTIEKMLDINQNLTSSLLSVNLLEAKNNLPYIQCLATFVHDDYAKKKKGLERAQAILSGFMKEYEHNQDQIFIIKKGRDFDSLQEKWGVILTLENAGAIEKPFQTLEALYTIGIRMLGLTWNKRNALGCGSLIKLDTGLTKLGKEYIREVERKKIAIDVSHLSEKSFWNVAKIVSMPIIASHSCCKSLCNHKRNLTDAQIKKIAESRGIIGINYYKGFLKEKGEATSKDIVNHIEYIVNLVGVDFVGLGSDFDGMEEWDQPKDIHSISDIKNIKTELEKRGFSQKEIKKILGENWKRTLKSILEY